MKVMALWATSAVSNICSYVRAVWSHYSKAEVESLLNSVSNVSGKCLRIFFEGAIALPSDPQLRFV